jgi:hypothetical protein
MQVAVQFARQEVLPFFPVFTLHLCNKLIMKSFKPELVFENVIDGNLICKRE